jgi:hypothetical protein
VPGVDRSKMSLADAAIMEGMTRDEVCLLVVPSKRVREGQFAIVLQRNGIRCRALGHGPGRVRSASGQSCVADVLVLAIHCKDVRRSVLRAKLCGLTFLCIVDANSRR